MKLSDFKFDVPKKLIALYPTDNRDESRLMVVHRKTGEIEHRTFKDILEYFGEGDVFVTNDTKVFPARLYGNKEKTGAKIEVFLLRELNPDLRLWDVLVDPARKIRIGNKLFFTEDESLVADVYGLKTDKEFVNTLEDNIRERGAMDKLISDCAKAEMSNRVKQNTPRTVYKFMVQ